MTLRLVASNPEPKGAPSEGPRILAMGAPVSPGPIPNDLARHLKFGEALIWWGEKDRVDRGPVLLAFGAALLALALVSGFAPELWSQPWSSLWPPLLALLSPTLFVLTRERLAQAAVLVTDAAVVSIDRDDRAARLAFDAVAGVQRDALRGGVRLLGPRGTVVRIPAVLMDDARAAIASQRTTRVRSRGELDDPTGWMP
jgi:hypothetical protein